MQDFRNLKIWQKGHELTLDIYKLTAGFPKTEQYGLVSQIRRASSSIPTNIAEGCGRHGNKELARFVQISMGSASEVEYQLILAHDLGYINQDAFRSLTSKTVELKKMMSRFINALRN